VPTKNVTLQVTGQVAHRNPNTKHKKNEVFLDVVEQVNLLMSHNGTLQQAHL
jgi:AP-2 complex subunit mu-1